MTEWLCALLRYTLSYDARHYVNLNEDRSILAPTEMQPKDSG